MYDNKTLFKDLTSMLENAGLKINNIDSNRHYWFIRTQGGSYFDEFFLDSFVGIGHEDVPCVAEEDRTEEIINKVKEGHAQATRVLNQVYKFCTEIKKGDIVIIPSAASAQFAFGYIEEDNYYIEEVSQEDIDEGKCPYTRRRRTNWIRGISKERVDPKLYTFFRNQQTLSQVDEYSEYIERALHSFYIKKDVAHFTLSVNTPESPNAMDIPLFMYGILIRTNALAAELKYPIEDTKVQCKRQNILCPNQHK